MSPFWILLEPRMMEVVVDNWSYKTYKSPVKSSQSTNQHPTFTGRMPFLSPNQQCHLQTTQNECQEDIYKKLQYKNYFRTFKHDQSVRSVEYGGAGGASQSDLASQTRVARWKMWTRSAESTATPDTWPSSTLSLGCRLGQSDAASIPSRDHISTPALTHC